MLAVVGFILLALGLLGLHIALQTTAVERLAFLALVLNWVGLTLPYYGAEVLACTLSARKLSGSTALRCWLWQMQSVLDRESSTLSAEREAKEELPKEQMHERVR